MKNRFLGPDYQRMPSVVPALETNNRIGSIRQQIDDLTLPFVTPLGAKDNYILPQEFTPPYPWKTALLSTDRGYPFNSQYRAVKFRLPCKKLHRFEGDRP